jgi:hypothetical protein
MSDQSPVPLKTAVFSNKQYDALKWLALVGLPALATLYFTVAAIWGLPKAHEVVGTIMALDTFLGLLLGVAKKNYDNTDYPKYDGELQYIETNSRLLLPMQLHTEPEDLPKKDSVTLKVTPVPPEERPTEM